MFFSFSGINDTLISLDNSGSPRAVMPMEISVYENRPLYHMAPACAGLFWWGDTMGWIVSSQNLHIEVLKPVPENVITYRSKL